MVNKYIKNCPSSLIIREMYVKQITIDHLQTGPKIKAPIYRHFDKNVEMETLMPSWDEEKLLEFEEQLINIHEIGWTCIRLNILWTYNSISKFI